jgi:hypothetical protein
MAVPRTIARCVSALVTSSRDKPATRDQRPMNGGTRELRLQRDHLLDRT